MRRPNKHNESSYAKRQRRRAESIIKATGVYCKEFRDMVQDALDNDLKRLPRLLSAADDIVKGREEIDRRFKEIMAGCLKPKPKNDCLEELLTDREEHIRQSGFEMCQLFGDSDHPRWNALADAIVELSNQTGVYYFHPRVIESFYRQAVVTAIEDGKDGRPDKSIQRTLNEIHALLNQSTPARIVKEIADRYNGEQAWRDPSDAYKAMCDPTETDDPTETADNPALTSLREKLAKLEYLPENEAIAFQIKSDIYRLEREADNAHDWPDVIGEEGGADAKA